MYIIILFFIINNLVFGDINLYLTKTEDEDINATCIETKPRSQYALIFLNTINHDTRIIKNVTTYWPYRQTNLNCTNFICFDNPTLDISKDNFEENILMLRLTKGQKDSSLRTIKFEVFSNRLCIIFPLKTINQLVLYVTAERNNQNFTETIFISTKKAWRSVKTEFKFPDSNKSNVTLIFEIKNDFVNRLLNLNNFVYIADLQECIKDYRSINAIFQPTTTNITCHKMNTNDFASNTSIRSTSKCASGYFGLHCDLSCDYYFGHQHEHCKGVLMCGQESCSCSAGYTGEYCQLIQKQSQLQGENVNNTLLYILIVLWLLLILFLIPTICVLAIKYKKIKYKYIDVKLKETPVFSEIHTNQQEPEYDEGFSTERSETNKVDMNQQSQTEPVISELKSIVHVVNKRIGSEKFPSEQNKHQNYKEIKKIRHQNCINEIKINYLDSNFEHVAPERHLKYVNVGANVNSKEQPIYHDFLPKNQATENKYVYDYVEVQRNIIL